MPAAQDVGQDGRLEPGRTYRLGNLVFTIPPGYELRLLVGVGDPGGDQLYVIYHEPSGSVLRINPVGGFEKGRTVKDAALNGVFDSIVGSFRTN
jgi:hypothetical protein